MVFTGISVGIILSVSRGEQEENWGQQTNLKDSKDKDVEAKAA
jgi:hypothetical protein